MANLTKSSVRNRGTRILAVALAVGGVVAAAAAVESRSGSTAHAGQGPALQHLALHKACTRQGGRFELSWAYNDRGVQWGPVLSCSTGAGAITCRDNLCRTGRLMKVDAISESGSETVEFPAEPMAFSAALAAISAK